MTDETQNKTTLIKVGRRQCISTTKPKLQTFEIVTIRNSNGRTITRNVLYFKRIPNQPNAEPDTDDEHNNDKDVDNKKKQAGNNQPERTNNEEVRRSSQGRKIPER